MPRHAATHREPEIPGIAGGPDIKEAMPPEPRKVRGAMPPSFGNVLAVDDDAVRRRALELWQAAGRPQGADLARWFEGVAPSRSRRRH